MTLRRTPGTFRLPAPAKVNLYLRVLSRRPDGFHELETIFERITLADELTFAPHPTLALTCTDASLSCHEDNLIMQAARMLQQASGTQLGAEIHLEKRIPIAAGLGGGSSDAATTLLGLNRLWQIGLSHHQLRELASRLGSDVAFFLGGSAFALGRGRGERCEPLDVPTRLAHVLVIPAQRLSTKAIYEDLDRRASGPFEASTGAQDRIVSEVKGFDLTASKPSITMVEHALSNGSLSELAEGLWNDLEPEAIRRCPIIARILSSLKELGCLSARVSGSGSSVFGLCRGEAHAQEIAGRMRLKLPGAQVHAVQTRLGETAKASPAA